ncbi:transposable element gene [Prunus dulcis]|uniref:Transposable element protein n=1 Tax=Prunus dulcis TaxID=3755 RepID=A0A4Y1R5N0_PRUDU|nr:transposable element gene [Prunus dulcis]
MADPDVVVQQLDLPYGPPPGLAWPYQENPLIAQIVGIPGHGEIQAGQSGGALPVQEHEAPVQTEGLHQFRSSRISQNLSLLHNLWPHMINLLHFCLSHLLCCPIDPEEWILIYSLHLQEAEEAEGETTFIETSRAVFIETNEEKTTEENFSFKETTADLLTAQGPAKEAMDNDQPLPAKNQDTVQTEEDAEIQQNSELRRSHRITRPALTDDYFVYLQGAEHDINRTEDPMTFKQAMMSEKSENWWAAMKSELNSMEKNGVWKLVTLPQGCKPIGCKWVFKTKRNSKGQVDRYKARLVTKGFTQKEGIDYNETFSPVSTKDSLRIIMALVAHFDLHLHQMDVKTAFLNGGLEEEIYMMQPEGFIQQKEKSLVCKLCKSIYGLKQASRQWYLKFNKVVKAYGFTEIALDECIYMKTSGRHFIILVLYVDDILLACTNLTLLHDCKSFLFKHFDMTDMAEASYVLGIDISINRDKGLLGLSHRSYIEKVLKRFNMHDCASSDIPIAKGDKLSTEQAPKTEQEKLEMADKPYASLVCTRPDLAFAVSMLGRFQSNPGQAHWVAGKKVMRYLQRTKDYKLLKWVESIHRPIQLWNDNSAAVTFAKGNKRTRGSRLLDVKFIIVKEKISQGYTTIDHIGTEQMIADPLTKGVPNAVFHRHYIILFYSSILIEAYVIIKGVECGYKDLEASKVIYANTLMINRPSGRM